MIQISNKKLSMLLAKKIEVFKLRILKEISNCTTTVKSHNASKVFSAKAAVVVLLNISETYVKRTTEI